MIYAWSEFESKHLTYSSKKKNIYYIATKTLDKKSKLREKKY